MLLWSGTGKHKTTTGPLGSVQKLRVMMIKQRGRFFRAPKCLQSFTRQICVRSSLSVYGVSYSCSLGEAKIRFLPAGQFQQHRHPRHFGGLRWTGKLRGGTGHLFNGPQHLRGAPALGVSPRLLPQLRERQVRVSFKAGCLYPRVTSAVSREMWKDH